MGRVNEITIDETIRAALEALLQQYGQTAELARKSNISRGQLSKYRTGATKTMPLVCWERLFPYIRPLLPKNYSPVNNKITMHDNHGNIVQSGCGGAPYPQLGEIETELLNIMRRLSTIDKTRVLTFANDLNTKREER